MPILTAVDLAELAPGVDQAQSGSISALLRRVQAWCESNLGAGRPLEAEQHREIIRVPWTTSQLAQLSRVPVSLAVAPIVEIRQGGPGAWTTISDTAYSLDEITGEIELFLLTTSGFRLEFDGYSYNQSSHLASTEIRATYTSGFDFTSTTDPDVLAIKAIAAELALFLWVSAGGTNQYSATALTASSGVGSGAISRETVADHYTIDYDTSATASSGSGVSSLATLAANDQLKPMIANILFPLQRYRPRRTASFGV